MIYVITKGLDDDYHICAVTTNYELAKKLRKIHNARYAPARIEGYDDLTSTECTYEVGFEGDGSHITCEAAHSINHLAKYPWTPEPVHVYPDNSVTVFVRAENKDVAIKLAKEMRAQALAEKEG